MVRKTLSLLVVMMMITITCYTVTAAISEFSADFTLTEAGGKVVTGKTFIKGSKIRKEATVEGANVITILRPDKKVVWTLMPEEKQYIEIGLAFDPARPSDDAGTEYAFDKKTIGHERVNGYDCDVIQYTYKKKEYGILVQWFSAKLNFAIKYQTKDSKGKVTSTQEYKNIKIKTMADSLFEIPAGYDKFSMDFKMP